MVVRCVTTPLVIGFVRLLVDTWIHSDWHFRRPHNLPALKHKITQDGSATQTAAHLASKVIEEYQKAREEAHER